MKLKVCAVLILFFVWISSSLAETCFKGECVVPSKDGVPIAYSVRGKGKTTLLFVHGWCSDSRYWREQVPYFSKKFKVVTVDLAGHGHSGTGREEYTMQAFGEDVKAVVDVIGAKKVILIGHSMGGVVIGEAAALLPGTIAGLVGVDTLQNVEEVMTQQEFDKVVQPLLEGFSDGVNDLVRNLFPADADQKLVSWVQADMSSADPQIALNAFDALFRDYRDGRVAKLFGDITAPVRSINGKLRPTDEIANRRHIFSYKVTYMDKVGHYPMLESPRKFNRVLERTIHEIIKETR